MSDQPADDIDVNLDREDLRDRYGNRVTPEYVERALADILDPHLVPRLTHGNPGDLPPSQNSIRSFE